MARIYNRSDQKEKRQQLRHDLTAPEQIVWQRLRAGQLFGFRFRRQYGVGRFVLDFYCPQVKLAIEIDGDSHYTKQGRAYDRERQDILESLGIRVLRFTNVEVVENIEGVLERIAATLNRPPPR